MSNYTLPAWQSRDYSMDMDPAANMGYTDPYTAGIQAIQPAALPGTGLPAESSWDAFSRTLFGGKDGMTGNTNMGLVTGGLGAAGSLLSGWTGLQQLQLAKDSLAFQKDSFNKNFANQQKLTNSQLEDRQRSRNMDSPGNYMATSDYMAKYGV